jgi:hypothetical protein
MDSSGSAIFVFEAVPAPPAKVKLADAGVMSTFVPIVSNWSTMDWRTLKPPADSEAPPSRIATLM